MTEPIILAVLVVLSYAVMMASIDSIAKSSEEIDKMIDADLDHDL